MFYFLRLEIKLILSYLKDSSGPAWVDKELRQLQADKLKKHRRPKLTNNTEIGQIIVKKRLKSNPCVEVNIA